MEYRLDVAPRRCAPDSPPIPRRQVSGAWCVFRAMRLFPLFAAPCVWILSRLVGGTDAIWLSVAAALVLAAGTAAVQRQFVLWSQGKGTLRLERGVAVRQETEVRVRRLTAVQLTRRPLLTILGAARVEFFLPSRKGAALSLLLPRERAAEMGRVNIADNDEENRTFTRFRPHRRRTVDICDAPQSNVSEYHAEYQTNGAQKRKRKFSAGMRSVLITAVMSANMFYGLFLALPMLYRIGRYTGDRPRQLYGELAGEGARLLGIPRAYAALLLLIPMGWAVHFAVKAIGLGRFHLTASAGGQMCLSRGVWTRRTLRFRLNTVTCADAVTTPLGLLLGLQRCEAEIMGAGRRLLYPAMSPRKLRIALASLLPRAGGLVSVTTPESHRWRLYSRWFAAAAGAVLLWLRLAAGEDSFPWGGVFLPVIWLLLWRGAAGMAAARRSGIYVSADWAEVTGVRGLSVHQMRVRRDRIARVSVSQSVFLRQYGLCHVRVIAKDARRGISCRYLPIERAMAVAEQLSGLRPYALPSQPQNHHHPKTDKHPCEEKPKQPPSPTKTAPRARINNSKVRPRKRAAPNSSPSK
ncbi:MAG: hypothetical protein E7559_07435 [Ruminococcaceae bacterium]|nr:hypothetical protein [Oscillospiraceae bacterium]